jgi:histone acetyltransferase (RNA polymerase elongator complex component)
MARFKQPTPEQEAGWKQWVAAQPEAVRKVAERFDPWTLYRLKTTNHRVSIVSFSGGTFSPLSCGKTADFVRGSFLCAI